MLTPQQEHRLNGYPRYGFVEWFKAGGPENSLDYAEFVLRRAEVMRGTTPQMRIAARAFQCLVTKQLNWSTKGLHPVEHHHWLAHCELASGFIKTANGYLMHGDPIPDDEGVAQDPRAHDCMSASQAVYCLVQAIDLAYTPTPPFPTDDGRKLGLQWRNATLATILRDVL